MGNKSGVSKSAIILRNLSVIAFIVVYFLMVIIHLVSDSFILSDQIYLILLLFPFILVGAALDYILRNNQSMKTWNRVVIQLLPLCIFAMLIISTVYYNLQAALVTAFNYLFWFFLSLPFFMASYQKNGLRQRIFRTLIGTGAVTVAYMFLTTQTKMLNRNYGATIIIISYFFMLYVASGIHRLSYIGILLGVLNAAVMILLRYFPLTSLSRIYGWDIDIANKVEMLLLFTFIFCVLVRIYEVVLARKVKAE